MFFPKTDCFHEAESFYKTRIKVREIKNQIEIR